MCAALNRSAATRGQVTSKFHGVDAIEIKATIADAQIDSALDHFKLSIDNDEERSIYFFDTPDLDLFKAGMIARARRIGGEPGDSTVKFRPVIPADVPQDWRKYEGFKLEADASESGVVKSASLTMPLDNGLIKQVVAGEKGIAKLFTQEQEDFLAVIGKQHIDYDTLSVLGPLQAHRWKFDDPACPWRITAELWKRQDGARLMEMSIKVPVVQAAVAIDRFMAFLTGVGAERDSEQQTKTRWALDHHSALLRDAKQA